MNINERSGHLNFGIVGCGTIAATHAGAMKRLDGASLAACCDTVPGRAAEFARQHGIAPAHVHSSLESLLGDPSVDLVSVCTPSGTHARIASASLRAGRPTIVEKPMDVSVAACEMLNAAQRETGLALGVISQHRFDSVSMQARELLDRGGLGKLLLVEAQVKWFRTQEYYDSGDWRGTWELDGGGALMNQGVHTVDLMRWLAGPVQTVYAVARTAAHQRIEVEDVVCATLTFEGGAIGNLVASTAAYPGFPATLSLHGEDGSLVMSGDVLHSIDTKTPVELSGRKRAARHAMQVAQGGTRSAESQRALEEPAERDETEWGDAHEAQLAEFVAAVREGRSPSIDGVAGQQAVQVVTAVYESARTGKTVAL